MNRRDFLTGLSASAGFLTLSSLLPRISFAQAMDNQFFVLFYLDAGFDGSLATAPWTADMEEGVERLREIARQQHPLVDRLKWQLELQQAEFDAFKAELWPTLSLRAERQRGQIDGTLAEGRRFYANLQYSLGAGATVIPKLEAAQVRVRALEQQQEGALKELDERLLQDWHDYATLRLRLPDLESVQEAARDLTESSKRLFVTGRKSWLDLQNRSEEHTSELQSH